MNLGLFQVTEASGTLENFAWQLFKNGINENLNEEQMLTPFYFF